MIRITFLLVLLFTFMSVGAKTTAVKKKKEKTASSINTVQDVQSDFSIGVNKVILNPSFKNMLNRENSLVTNGIITRLGNSGNSDFSYSLATSEKGNSQNIYSESRNIIPSNSMESNVAFQLGLFYGFSLMLIMLNLVCFFLFEEKTYLYYAATLLSTTVLLFYTDGLFSLIGLDVTFSAGTLFLLCSTTFGVLFASKYLQLNEYVPKLKWISYSVISIATILLISSIVSPRAQLLNIANTMLFGVLIAYFIAGVILFSKKNYAKFYVIAAAIPLLFMIDFFLLRPLGVEFLSTETTHIKAAAIAEMLVLTYAIMFRMQALKEEHSMRQAEMRIFLKRQEALSARQKTEKLMEDEYLENLIMHYDLDGLEIKLLQYISEGKDNAKIARKLKVTEHEIEDYTKDLYNKLEISVQIQQDYRMVESQPDYIYN